MFVEQVSALATLISDITMSLHRPVEGFHAERYNIMLGFLSYTSNVFPNPLTQDTNRCLQSVNFLFSLVGHLFSQSTRIVPARLPGISIRDVQSCVMSLNRYMIDSHIFEVYSLNKSDRIHLTVGSRGVVRLAGATGGSRTVFHDGRVAQGILIPGSHIYKIGLESYTIITNIPRNIVTPGYVMTTSLAYDSSMTVLIYDAAAQAIGSLVMGARPEVVVDGNTINEGLFVTCGAGTNILVRPPGGMNACICAHLNFSDTSVFRGNPNTPIMHVTDPDLSQKWAHVNGSASPAVINYRGIILGNTSSTQYLQELDASYRYIFVDLLYRITVLAEALNV